MIRLLLAILLAFPANLYGDVAFQDWSWIDASTGADVTVNLPAHAADDIFLIQCLVRDQDDTASITGYTQIDTVDRSTVSRYWWFWRRATSASETDPVFDKSTATGDTYCMVSSYRGAITTEDPWEVKGTPATGTANPGTLNGITSLTNNALIVASIGSEDNDSNSLTLTGTDPADYTENYADTNVGSDGSQGFGYATRTSAGATGDVSAEYSKVQDGWGGIVLSLKPEPAAVGGEPMLKRNVIIIQ